MPRTGQPSTRDVEATVRAVEILDVLAEGGELGTTDVSRRTGISASTVSRQLGTLTRVGLVEHVAATGRYRLGVRTLRYANAVLGRLNLRDLARPHLEELVHQVGETATLSIPGRQRRDHRRLRADRPLPAGRDAARPAERRPCLVGRQGDARVRRRAAPAGQAPGLHAADDHRPGGARARDRTVRDPGYAEAIEEREAGLSAVAAPIWGAGRASRRSSPSRARRAASTRRRSRPPCRSSSPAPSGSRSRSAGTSSDSPRRTFERSAGSVHLVKPRPLHADIRKGSPGDWPTIETRLCVSSSSTSAPIGQV